MASEHQSYPPALIDDVAAERHQLAILIGRLLARAWLSEKGAIDNCSIAENDGKHDPQPTGHVSKVVDVDQLEELEIPLLE